MVAMKGPDSATLLRRYRLRVRLTQQDLAESASLSTASVSLLEHGVTQTPQKTTVDMFGAAFALPPQERPNSWQRCADRTK